MAIIKLGAMVVGVRGTIGGITYSANRSGQYAKSWSRPTRNPSLKQSQIRNFPALYSNGWRSLTTTQRNAWNTYAAAPAQALTNSLGQTYYATGFNWYLKVNTACSYMGVPWQTAPPAAPTAPFTEANILVISGPPSGPLAKVYTSTVLFSMTHYYAVFAEVRSQSRSIYGTKHYKLMQIAPPLDVNTIVFTAPFQAIWGNPIATWRTFCKVTIYSSTGRSGGSLYPVNQNV